MDSTRQISSGKTPQDNLSLSRIINLRGEAHATIRQHAATIISVGAALEALDVALQRAVATGLGDDQQALLTAGRSLAALLSDGGGRTMNAVTQHAARMTEREAELAAWTAQSNGQPADDVQPADNQAAEQQDANSVAKTADDTIEAEADDSDGDSDQPVETDSKRLIAAEADDDAHRLGRLYLHGYRRTETGDSTIVFYHGEFYRWEPVANSYHQVSGDEIRGEITKSAKNELDAIATIRLREHLKRGSDDKPPITKRVTRSLVGNVLGVIESMAGLSSKRQQPCWLIDDDSPFDANETLVTQNGLLHLPSLGTGRPSLLPPTPLLFSSNAIGCGFDPTADCPEWLNFLATVWGDDGQCIDTLGEWFGYLLLPDVRHHKILVLVGPPRSGKGTIGRVLKSLLGAGSVANPTMSSLAGPFGLWPLHNKMAAIISDARLSSHVDAMTILERLLSISGGDPQNIDRKCLPSLTAVMMAVRFTILTNEIPRLTDASGAIASRFIILQMTRSCLGREDKVLDRKLAAELPGILDWAIRGWQRLRDRGHFIQPESARDLAKELRDIASPVGMFIREACLVGPEWSVDVADIYASWCDWCKEHGRDHPGTEQTFGKDLRAAVPGLSIARPRISGDRVRRYNGVGFNPSGPRWSATHTIGHTVEKEWIR